MKRGDIWWADLGPHRPFELTGVRPVVIWQSDTLNQLLRSVVVIPLTTNMQRAGLVGTVFIPASDIGPPEDSLAIAFQVRTISKTALRERIPSLSESEIAELEMAADEAFGRLEPQA